jgi:hypothetical protein
MADHIVIDFEEDEKKPQAEKENQQTYLGLWVSGLGGNTPIALFNPEVAELAKEFAEAHWPKKHIFGTVLIPERKLITRQNTKR